VNPQRHNAMRNAMLEQYYHYRHPYLRDTRSPGEDFEVAEELDDLLEQIKVVVDEWHRKPGGDERNEAVRVLELPLIQSLALRVISPKDRDRIIDMLDDFITMGDDTRAKKEAKELRDRLKED
ncbi:hypothetical protein KKA01_00760, partial [Patescibacteria group bacterium]|nr:hypothetical protein [Patescibacteria group bacterium]